MSLPIDIIPNASASEVSPLSKRRRFTPQSLPPFIPSADNSAIEHHTFGSPLIAQLCEQAPTPEEIEEGLLQVGMRVRKSVNEGYKIQQKKFTPRPFGNNLHKLSPETQQALMSGNSSQVSGLSPYSAGGLHNVGGMAMQPIATATFCGINLAALSYSGHDWSNPGVAEQTLWSYSTSYKRGYEGDSDSDESQEWQPKTPSLPTESMQSDYFNIDMDAMSDVSNITPISEPYQVHIRGRRMAKPKSKLGLRNYYDESTAPPVPPPSTINPFLSMAATQQTSQFDSGFNQSVHSHRRMTSCGIEININDLSEAPFLQRREDVEMDCS